MDKRECLSAVRIDIQSRNGKLRSLLQSPKTKILWGNIDEFSQIRVPMLMCNHHQVAPNGSLGTLQPLIGFLQISDCSR